ncbi:aldo/keto reductase [Halarchaeum sp. P4]|uniref:aldo/keto reductase n=1 Tax=Halarchaeum sp. P4 TaxID=3421639 RepID=UPI003EBE5E41
MDDLPPVGLGTMGIDDPNRVAAAIDAGYRHLDTASVYDNEAVVGEGIARADTPREELFVATKLWIDDLAPERVRPATEAALERLGLDSVDLLYVHRPRGDYKPAETLPEIDAVHDDGLTERVGVSNFLRGDLELARQHLDVDLFANQIELHPYWVEEATIADAREHDYAVVGYSPLANGDVFDDPVLQDIAADRDATVAQVAIAWCLERADAVIPKGTSRAHQRENLAAADLDLSGDDLARIDAIERENEVFPE